jgi:hypothetical protein
MSVFWMCDVTDGFGREISVNSLIFRRKRPAFGKAGRRKM